jgi:hypothetical protein
MTRGLKVLHTSQGPELAALSTAQDRKAGNMNETNASRGASLLRFSVAGGIVALYAISVFLKVFVFRGTEAITGGELLLIGWVGILAGAIGWYANLLFVPGLILFAVGNYRMSRWFALAALMIALTSLLIREWPSGWGPGDRIASFGPGIYAWLGSMALLTAGSFGVRALSQPLSAANSD